MHSPSTSTFARPDGSVTDRAPAASAPPADRPTGRPAKFLQPGDILETWIDGVGTIRNNCV
jgi:2-keto-4-pentenoate hydratase/2-oxohepta-3-ene-1,7-dioic acid hydratase in catechol pathway